MAPKCPLLLLLLVAVAALAEPAGHCSAPPDRSSTLIILPAFGPCSPFHPSTPSSYADTIFSLANRDVSRVLYLSSLAATPIRTGPRRSFVPIASGRSLLQSTTYVARASLGTPPQPLLVALDISSDAAWFPCASCSGCPATSTSFSPNRSSSFLSLPCGSPQCSQVPNPSCLVASSACAFNLTYGGSSIFSILAKDSLSLAADSVKSYTFGCVTAAIGATIPPQGLLGLGRGPLSFLSQTKTLYASTFSYCLPGYRSANFSGTLRLGPAGQPKRIHTTPLLFNPHRPSFYYVNMTGIRVGNRLVPIPPSALSFDTRTGAGTIFDSGTMFTRLVAPAYAALRDEYRRRANATVSSLGGFDTCYKGPVALPTITFQFDGMNMTLTDENTVIHSSSGGISCLAMAAAPDNVNSVLNVIASMQQQNHRVVFDVPNGRVGVSREPCTS